VSEDDGWVRVEDLTRPEPLAQALEYHRADTLVALAGVTSGASEALDMNTTLALAALEAARKAGLKKVFFMSSAAVYGRGEGGMVEECSPNPAAEYGRAKLAMEQAVRKKVSNLGAVGPQVTILRLGNVAGADMLLGGLVAGRTARMDIFANGAAPARSYIGVESLWRVLESLSASKDALPPILNIAAPGVVTMTELLDAAGHEWERVDAPPTAIELVEMDTTLLGRYHRFNPVESQAAEMVRQWRKAKEAAA